MPIGIVAALEQGDRVAAGGGVEGDPGAGDPAADHDDLEALRRRSPRSLGPRDHPTAGRRALRKKLGHLVDRRPLRRCFFLARRPEMEEADEALAAAEPDGAPPRLAPQHLGRPPVAGEAAGVGGEQDDVGGDRGRVQVLLVLDRDRPRARRRRRPASAPGRAWPRPRGRRPPSARRAIAGRGRGTARARSGGGWAPTAPARAAPRAPRGRAARARTPCGCGGCGSPSRHPSARRISLITS